MTTILPGEHDIKVANGLKLPLMSTCQSATPHLFSRATTLQWLLDNQVIEGCPFHFNPRITSLLQIPVPASCVCTTLRQAADFIVQHIDKPRFVLKRLENVLDVGVGHCDIVGALACADEIKTQRQVHGARWRQGARLQQPLVRIVMAELADILRNHVTLWQGSMRSQPQDFIHELLEEGFVLQAAATQASGSLVECGWEVRGGLVVREQQWHLPLSSAGDKWLSFEARADFGRDEGAAKLHDQLRELIQSTRVTGTVTTRVGQLDGDWVVDEMVCHASPQHSISQLGTGASIVGTFLLADAHLQPYQFNSLLAILRYLPLAPALMLELSGVVS